jgi:hypothetical protein
MKAQRQIVFLVALLVSMGLAVILYKHFVLGFPLSTSEEQEVWQIEARLDFVADGGPAEVRLNLPDQTSMHQTVFGNFLAPGYEFARIDENGVEMGVWTRADAPPGPAAIVLYSEVFFSEEPRYRELQPPEVQRKEYEGNAAAAMAAANAFIEENGLAGDKLVRVVLTELNSPSSSLWELLQRDRGQLSERLALASEILAQRGIAAQEVRGVVLEDRQRNRKARRMLGVYLEDHWQLYDPGEAERVPWKNFLPFEQGGHALFEVRGGRDSKLEFSVIKTQRAAFLTAVEQARNHRSWLVDFSIYSLPIEQQSTFKLLLLIPLGALVVVILRNLVGIRTSGTFMPILIAMAFLQTKLLTGLVLFLVVVSIGLFVRSYLTRLNLLLVPRIASVLVFVIIIYAAIGIASHKLGLDWGMKVTFFPMIILSWTIERMSILWDEEGPHEVLIQGGGSLLTASLAYLVMSNSQIADYIFLYPEALLILLAIIIAIGSYSGYRLSDLRRFEPMERY